MSTLKAARVSKVVAALALALLATPPASANGRFPRAERLLEQGPDGQRLLLAATYGLLSSADPGQSWDYICHGTID